MMIQEVNISFSILKVPNNLKRWRNANVNALNVLCMIPGGNFVLISKLNFSLDKSIIYGYKTRG